jgi:two-component system sensor histidine kinase PilS (NtrC family)
MADIVANPGATAAADGEMPGSGPWRLLFLFNLYRLAAATLLLVAAELFSDTISLGSQDQRLYFYTAAAYVVFSVACFPLIAMRRSASQLLSLQVGADVLFISLLMFASGGVSSGIGLLLLTTLAGAGLISRGRLTLFYAAVASIAVLLEHSYEVLQSDASSAQYLQAALLCIGYFATAWVAHVLARYAVASEALAARRGIDMANLAEINERIIGDMRDGVLVADDRGVVRQFNRQAVTMLQPLCAMPPAVGVLLGECVPALSDALDQWRRQPGSADQDRSVQVGDALGASFVPVGRSRSDSVVIFLTDIRRARAEVRQMKLAAMGHLSANIAHEIRNPLGAISHAGELLQEEAALGDDAQRLLRIIHDNTRRLERIVQDVLKVDRRDTAHREVFSVCDYLNTFVSQFCEIEKIPRSIFVIDRYAEPMVDFDRSHLNQVMWNLSRNALRHCRRGPASIRIAVNASAAADTLKLAVMDDGPGIPAAARSQLFEPFFTTAAGGTGLGLYIAREVCAANDATLEFVETPRGAQFTIQCKGGGHG